MWIEDDFAFHHIGQLPHIAGPGIIYQPIDHAGSHIRNHWEFEVFDFLPEKIL